MTDPDQIVATMQAWYERTAERVLPQTETLSSFLARHHSDLPQIDDDQKEALEEEFTIDEVKQAIRLTRLVPRDPQGTQLLSTNYFSAPCPTQ